MLGKVYLLCYNACLFLGWTVVLVTAVKEMVETSSPLHVYKKCEVALKVSQSLAVLEILHAIVGLVKSSPFTTLIQVQSRLVVLWLVLHPVVEVQGESNVAAMICAWSVAEMVRYSYYALSLVDCVPYFLTWCRYSFFTFLYPIGVSGELLTIYSILPYAAATGMYSISMPNMFNVAFHYPTFLVVYMIGYVPYLPKLYMYMLTQRGKVLGRVVIESEKKAS